jgi:hypothetical protein
MLNLLTDSTCRDCAGYTRRGFLQAGTLGLGGLCLSEWLALRAQAAEMGSASKDTSVVLLFLTGGASQIETFDPKMTAPEGIRTVTGEVKTSLSGVTFGGTFPKLAQRAHRLAVVRSFSHAISDHTKAVQQVTRGGNPAKAGMGALAARLRGTSHSASGTPTNIYLSAREIDPQFHKEKERLREASGPGQLGGRYAPFQPGGDSTANQDLQLNVPLEQLKSRRTLAEQGNMDSTMSTQVSKKAGQEKSAGEGTGVGCGLCGAPDQAASAP